MYVVHAAFRLDGITVTDYLRHCDEVAPEYAAIPGLLSKIWLAAPENSRFGAVYICKDEAACDAFRASEFFQKVAETPFVAA
ncbi:hypothetical protein amrb99_30770 [Actinomadura sp. RB99]|uniref:YdhR family protein n=1 Tax=Actinomadura sp. RB99 TaxID=2691577 RepID=UPI001688A61F|nr:YdhR family protein [Actinomadura sp. RB99]MBD2894154.1 hypothetical protein [Actinomadura sp. RB99]